MSAHVQLIMQYIGKILPLCQSIFSLVAEVKANKKRCRRLADRVKALRELVEVVRKRGPSQMPSYVSNSLRTLSITLTEAQELVQKCTKTKFLNMLKYKSKFDNVNESLSDTFQVLSGALQVEQRSMMHQMFQDYGEDDDDDWSDGVGLYGNMAALPYSGAVVPVPHPAAAPPVPFFGAAAPYPQPAAAFYAASVEIDDDYLVCREALFLVQ